MKSLQSYFPPMPEKQFQSMVSRNGITQEKLDNFQASLERSRNILAQGRKLTYSCLITMRTNALWAVETWYAEAQKGTIGALDEAIRYFKILVYIEKRMFEFKGVVA